MRKIPTIESTLDAVIKSGKGYPEPEWLASYRGISVDEAYSAMVSHRANANWELIGVSQPVMPVKPISVDMSEIEVSIENPSKHHMLNSVHNAPKDILRIIFAALSVLTAIRSWGFIYGWFAQWDSGIMSAIMAFILCGALITLPQAIIIAWQEQRIGIMIITSMLVIVCVIFSMIATIGGLYNDRSQSIETSQDTDSVKNEAILSQMDSALSDSRKDKESDSIELSLLQRNIGKYEVGTIEYNRTVNRIDATNARIATTNAKIENLNGQKNKILEKKNFSVKRNGFYGFLATVTGAKESDIEFGISLIVSAIVDISGPVFATLALFL